MAVALLAAGGGDGFATKLDKEACKSLGAEIDSLVTTGVKADMDRGPDWGKANLAPARLEDIKRLIELSEQLEFRCGAAGTDGARLARKPEADDDDSKGAGAKQLKRGKHGMAQRSEAAPEPDSPGATPAAGAAEARTAASDAAPGAQAGTPAMPVKTLNPGAAEAKVALQPAAKEPAGEGAGGDEDAAPSLGNAAAGRPARHGGTPAEAAAAPTLGKAGTPTSRVEASHQETAAEEPPALVPNLGKAGAEAAVAAPTGPKSATAPAALDAPSLGKATSGATAASGPSAGKKAQRHRSNAYVSPTEVNPAFVSSYAGAR